MDRPPRPARRCSLGRPTRAESPGVSCRLLRVGVRVVALVAVVVVVAVVAVVDGIS